MKSTVRAFVLSLFVAALVGCDNEAPTPSPAPAPTPVSEPPPPSPPPPAPLRDLSGTWSGSIEFNPSSVRPSCPIRADIQVPLTQFSQTKFSGTTTTPVQCYERLKLTGELGGNVEGARLTMQLWTYGGDERIALPMHGTASSTKLEVSRRFNHTEGYPIAIHLAR
jgi:hypothetical protein